MPGSNIVNIGIDLKEFYPSVEWDILEIPAGRNEEYYPESDEPFSGKKCHLSKKDETEKSARNSQPFFVVVFFFRYHI